MRDVKQQPDVTVISNYFTRFELEAKFRVNVKLEVRCGVRNAVRLKVKFSLRCGENFREFNKTIEK